jgi:hypothetical protein
MAAEGVCAASAARRLRGADPARALLQASRCGMRRAMTTRGSRRSLTARHLCLRLRAPAAALTLARHADEVADEPARASSGGRDSDKVRAARSPARALASHAESRRAEAACARARGAPAGRRGLPVAARREPRRRSWCARRRLAACALQPPEAAACSRARGVARTNRASQGGVHLWPDLARAGLCCALLPLS